MPDKYEFLKHLSRRQILKYGLYSGLAGLLPSLWVDGCTKFKRTSRPNVLLIVLDTTRADRFSCMGYTRETTPNIDTIFSDGIIYERAYSTACWTLPAHASLFTGLYPIQAGATSETLQLPAFNVTLTETLKKAGYDTAAFVCNPWVGKERGFDKGFTEYYEMWQSSQKNQLQVPIEFNATNRIISWLSLRDSGKNPFFVFVNLNCAHLPYRPIEPFLSTFVGNRGYNNEEVNRIANIMSMWDYLAGELQLTQRDFNILNDLYDGVIAQADHYVGQIINHLQAAGTLDNTLVIVTSDHGENLGEHGRIDHNLSLHETTLHIPLMIRYPSGLNASGRVKDLVSITDIAPTVLDLCGLGDKIEKLKPSQTSLARKNRHHKTFVIATNERPITGIALMKDRHPDFDTTSIDYRLMAIHTEPHKLIWTVDKSMELFDLQTDPGELNNLADTKIEIRDKLHKILVNWIEQIPSAKNTFFLEGQDEESLKILRSLGYLK